MVGAAGGAHFTVADSLQVLSQEVLGLLFGFDGYQVLSQRQ